MTDHTPAQHEAAIQEGERIAAADEYFKARTWIMDTNDNRRIFEAGFDRAYALLSKLRAPVADEQPRPRPPMCRISGVNEGVLRRAAMRHRAAEELQDPSALAALADGLESISGNENAELAAAYIRRESNRLASAPVADRQRLRDLVDTVWNEATASTEVPSTPWADRLINRVFPSSMASAPVAGEAQPSDIDILGLAGLYLEPARPATGAQVVNFSRALLRIYAAPQASEAVRDEALEEAAQVCDRSSLQPAIASRIRALKTQPQVDKGGAENTVDGKGFSGFANSENAAQSGGAETGYNSPESRANPRDTVVLPPLGKPPGRGLYHTHKEIQDYARAAVLADRQQRARDPVIGRITVKGRRRSSVDLDASHVDLPEGEYVIRAALSAQPGAQQNGGGDAN